MREHDLHAGCERTIEQLKTQRDLARRDARILRAQLRDAIQERNDALAGLRHANESLRRHANADTRRAAAAEAMG